ncbi:MAG: FecR domain-containing protein [Acidobacteria bacterium]|nr:FecR domain-containing protein [Acidobacteriota bacterium]MBV9475940.1 FecR domain-containing protein [Acidobacteriota bacterium]
MKQVLASLLTVFAVQSAVPQSALLDYRFEEVRHTVTLTAEHKSVVTGEHARSGDGVETGWFSYARIASATHRAEFELFSSTSVTLAGGTPGVVLSLQRGRIRAAFDKLTGSEPRIVQTPGALLAVRGTKFDVEVARDGNTTVDVFEGVVEVRSPLQHEPLFVRAGEESIYGHGRAPAVQPMPQDRRNNAPGHDGERGTQPHDGSHRDPRGGDGNEPGNGPGGFGGPDGPSGHQPPPPPNPGPPPNKPPVA